MTVSRKRLPGPPLERVLAVVAGRWKSVLLWRLEDGPKRLSELQRLIPPASQKVLIEQLRELEGHGMVSRAVFPEVPSRVEYALTDLARDLQPHLRALHDWSVRNRATLDAIDGLPPGAPSWCDRLEAAVTEAERDRRSSRAAKTPVEGDDGAAECGISVPVV